MAGAGIHPPRAAWESMSTPYCTLAQVKSALGIDANTTTDDSWISGDLIPQAQADIDSYTGLTWNPTSATYTYDGNDTDTILIDRATGFTQVLLTPAPPPFSGALATPPQDITTDCVLGPRLAQQGYGFLLTRKSGLDFNQGTANVSVTATYGMPGIPPNLTRAATRLVIHYYKMRDANYTEVVATGQFGAMRFNSVMPDDVTDLLERIKPRRFLMK